jgi:hypothetical protein
MCEMSLNHENIYRGTKFKKNKIFSEFIGPLVIKNDYFLIQTIKFRFK